MKNAIRKIATFIRRKRCKHSLQKKPYQTDVTIISNNCLAGIVYSDYGMRFLSPTINLYFGSFDQFVLFVCHIREYCEYGTLKEKETKEQRPGFFGAPIGLLKADEFPEIEIHFLHYDSFEEARRKWHDRCKRINYRKIYLLVEAQDIPAASIEALSALPYPKTIFCNKEFSYNGCRQMPFYEKYGTGDKCPILKFVDPFGRRGFDPFDPVKEIFTKKYE